MTRSFDWRAFAARVGSLATVALAVLAAGAASAQEAGYGQTLGTSPM